MKNVRETFCTKFLPYVFYCRGLSVNKIWVLDTYVILICHAASPVMSQCPLSLAVMRPGQSSRTFHTPTGCEFESRRGQ